ncbi:MAG: pyridoxine 5'-phosphate synthase [Desulfobacterales bacterium]|nr:pyridoxine 5'-phosphate synthase [Desulfobacterales bacterium]
MNPVAVLRDARGGEDPDPVETESDKELDRIYRAAKHAVQVGLKVSAGHGLNYSNILPVLKARAMEEVSIGHAIIARAVFVGLARAVEEMLEILE